MFSKYFKFKIKTDSFNDNLNDIVESFKDKKILVCADKKEFGFLDKKYKLSSLLNIVSIVFCNQKSYKEGKYYKKIKVIDFNQIKYKQFDYVLITSENSINIFNKLTFDFGVDSENIQSLFVETIKDGRQNLEYALKYKFESYLKNLKKKLKNKKIMVYGAGLFFRLLCEYFDFSDLNIIGVVDKKYKNVDENKEFLGYKTFKPENIISENPDYLIIATKKFVPIFENLYFDYLDKTNIKIIPIIKKNIFSLLSEIEF